MSKITISEDIELGLKSIDDVKSDWLDDDLDSLDRTPKYKVHVKREILDL